MAVPAKKKKSSVMERARARLKRMQEGDKNSDFLTLVKGKNVVRVLPNKDPDGDWYAESASHFFKDGACLCPKFIGKKCPACIASIKSKKEGYRLKDEYEKGGERNHKLKKAMEKAFRRASELKARNRFLLNVVPLVLGKETQSGKEVKVLACGPQIMNGILTYYTDTDEYGNVLDLKRGRDFIITKKVTGKKAWDVDYEVKLRDKERCQPVHPKRLKDLHDLAGFIGEYPDYDEVLAIMEGRASSDESSDADDEDDDRHRSKLSSKKKRGKPRDEDDEDEEDLDEESDADEEEDESDEDSDESSDDDDDESSEDEDDDADEEENERPSKKKGKAKKKASRRDDDDEEEEDEDSDDGDDDEDDESSDEDSDEGDEDDEDEDADDEEEDDSDDEDDDDDGEDGDSEDEDRPRKSKSKSMKSKLKKKARG